MPITFDNVTINNGITINYEVTTVTGGTLTYDGSYSVRTFTSNDTLGISGGTLSFGYLVAAAGGKGGTKLSGAVLAMGGGGGGQVLYGNAYSSSNIAVTIGLAASGNGVSILDSIATCYKGSDAPDNTFSGGDSGSGAYTGGSGQSIWNAGGGGGQTANGSNGSGVNSGDTQYGGGGGAGVNSTISGSSINYGQGGPGAARDFPGFSGSGYGTGGKQSTAPVAPTNYRGTGGPGGYAGFGAGLNGADGVVIIRYLTAGTN